MPWRNLSRFRDPRVPKLDNLRRAAARGLRVPETFWVWAAEGPEPVPPPIPFPLILRSGSPTEDTRETSNAGQLLSLRVPDAASYGDALRRVIEALPCGATGARLGAVFAQPIVEALEAGVAFFDGFYYERTLAPASNESLTSGQARGEVVRGHLERNDAWSSWLHSVHRVFHDDAAGTKAIDVEVARDARGYVLLQARPALFPVARNESLSLSNHREILGDLPSPWITSVLLLAGREALAFFAAVDPEVGRWGESYAILLAERCWGNDSFFFRLMDRWGLPRSLVTEGFGGRDVTQADRRIVPPAFLSSIPKLVLLQARSVRDAVSVPRRLAALDRRIAEARTLGELHDANVAALGLALTTNFAINGVLSGVVRLRRALGIRGAVRVVTQEMMERFEAIGSIADTPAREDALSGWLSEYGHRGPLESDPARPRFRELSDLLRVRLASSDPRQQRAQPASLPSPIVRPLFWFDARREWFRSELMKRWERLRARILEEGARLAAAGAIDRPEDVFLLTGGGEASPRRAIEERRRSLDAARALSLPAAASRDAVAALVARAADARDGESGATSFRGIALSAAVIEGTALKADDLVTLISSGPIEPGTILVVPALEPSWALVFPQVAGVVAEVGGELSHASILLREASKPAVVNCAGIFRGVRTGDRLRLDGAAGRVEIVARAEAG